MPHQLPEGIAFETILNQTSDGIYVTNRDCRILFWNNSAEAITGWKAKEVVGKRCRDDILMHLDESGKPLCHPGRCPLHRCMATGCRSGSKLVWANHRDGHRVPVDITVAPLSDGRGMVTGGVEIFRDASERMLQLEQARRVQQNALPDILVKGPVKISALFQPQEAVGGDIYQLEQLPGGDLAFLVADFAGHGVAAALYTMTMHALWQQHRDYWAKPAEMMSRLNKALSRVIVGDSFATAVMGLISPARRTLVYSSAGHPPAWLRKPGGTLLRLPNTDHPLGMLPDWEFTQDRMPFEPGFLLVAHTDAALEAFSPGGEPFGDERLYSLLEGMECADPDDVNRVIAHALQSHAQSPHLEDDLTILSALYRGEC